MIRLFLVCAVAGIAAGAGTGFAGMSATTVIAPMLISFLGYPWYEAVGIGLASDVLASVLSAYVYKRNNNMDLKDGIVMVIAVLVMTVVGSYTSQFMPDVEMGRFSMVIPLYLGLRFIIFPATKDRKSLRIRSSKVKIFLSVICGMWIGFYCGFMGMGGGLMMLFILTTILGYDLKTAVGTSVFVMSFIAFTGAVSHVYFGDVASYLPAMGVCIVFTLLAAIGCSALSNHMEDKTTNRVTGVVLFCLGLLMLFQTIF